MPNVPPRSPPGTKRGSRPTRKARTASTAGWPRCTAKPSSSTGPRPGSTAPTPTGCAAGPRGRRPNTPEPVFLTAVADALGAGGTTVALFGSDETELLVAASNPVAMTAHDLEFTFGQGPARETVRRRRAVTAAGRQLEERWPAYGPAVRRLGVRALAAVPVNVAGVALGALTVFDPPPGSVPDLEAFSAAADMLAASLTPEAGDSGIERYGTWSSLWPRPISGRR